MTRGPGKWRFGSRLLMGFVLVPFLGGQLQADVVVLNNGDRINGEIKGLETGVLRVDPDYAESVFEIDWGDVVSVESEQTFVAEISSGQRVNGSLARRNDGQAGVRIGAASFPLSEVVMLEELQTSFWKRLGLTLEGGYDFAKARTSKSARLMASVDYTTNEWEAATSLAAYRQSQESVSPTRRTEFTVSYQYYIAQPWYAAALVTLLNNEEQQLQLRSSYGGGLGRHIVSTNRSRLSFLVGATWTNELYLGVPRSSSAEALAGLDYNAFNIGDLTLRTTMIGYLSLTEKGRIRFDFSSNLKWDLIGDFYLTWYYWDNFDSAPPNNAPSNDLGVGTAFGWDY